MAARCERAERAGRRLLVVAIAWWPLAFVACMQASLAPMDDQVALPASDMEGAAHGFPQMRTLDGASLADGEFTQRVDGDRIHVRIHYRFDDEHWAEEQSVIRQSPELAQESWTWQEVVGDEVQRRFEIDFVAGTITSEKREEGKLRRWSERVELERGRAFAGSGFSLALKSLRDRLERGETVELRAIGFLPEPKAGVVEVSYAGLDEVPMAGRTLVGEHYVLHPKIPAIVRLFVKAPDTHLWLTSPAPAAFLRWEGPLAEPSDPIVRIDLLPGDPSGAARPLQPSARDVPSK